MPLADPIPALDRFLVESRLRERLSLLALLHEEMNRPAANFEAVLQRLEAEPALARQVRHAACSAWFGGHESQCDLAEAFARMGVTEFHRLVVTTVVHTRTAATVPAAFVGHADLVARLCEFIARRCTPALTTSAAFTGLCHDVAVPAMGESLVDYQYFTAQALSPDPDVGELERACHGFDHARAGAELLAELGFAADLTLAVRHHHEPRRLLDLEGDAARLLAMLLIAERVIAVSLEQSAGIFGAGDEAALPAACEKWLGLQGEQLQALEIELLEHCRPRRAGA